MADEYLNSLNIRRSDLDDSDFIEEMIQKSNTQPSILRFFGSNNSVVKLIETSYLSVTALDPYGTIVAFCSFDDHPPGLKSNDNLHENQWENWFSLARGVDDDLNSHNTLWIKFLFISPIEEPLRKGVVERVFQSAYCSLPNVRGILLLARGEATPDDYHAVGFISIQKTFEELELYRREVLSDVRGVHFNSVIYYSDKSTVIPAIEIRTARQEDHDNLAQIFNTQSEVVTETYGDYFIAELIAAQDDSSRCLVGQVHDKAIGLLAVRSDIDTHLLWQCFELDTYDNLYDPTYMDIVHEKQEEIKERRRIEAEERARQEARRLKEETMICNIIAQRTELQEYLMLKADEIFQELDEVMGNHEKYSQMDARGVEKLIEGWLDSFVLRQPSDYFLDHPTDDPYLYCNILTETEFFLECLQFFGLHENYMNREGHYITWYRKKEEEEKQAAARKGAVGTKLRGRRDAKRGDKRATEERKLIEPPPEHFDLEPLKDSLRKFLEANSENRTKFRQEIGRNLGKLEYAFKGEDGQLDKDSFHINTTNFALHLEKAGLIFEGGLSEVLGPMLRCFGLLRTEKKPILTQPPAPVEEEKKPTRVRGGKRGQQEKEQQVQMSKIIECGVEVQFQKDREGNLLADFTILMKTSFNEVIRCVGIIQDYDTVLCQLGIVSGPEIKMEVEAMEDALHQEQIKLSQPQLIPQPSQQSHRKGSGSAIGSARRSEEGSVYGYQQEEEDQDYYDAVADLDDLEYIPEPPERAKNAFGLVLYCMDEAFEAFGIDFLESAFDQFPDRDYMIITQPHTVPENSLMRFFIQAQKKPNNTFNHVLYIMHRDSLLYKDIKVRVTTAQDLNNLDYVMSSVDNKDDIIEIAKTSIINQAESQYVSFSVSCKDEIIGLFVLSKDVNLKYYRSHFHIEDFMILNEYNRTSHTRLLYTVLNPIFLKCQNLILRDILRLLNKTCLYFEIHDFTVIPEIFRELLYVRSRRFPHFLVKEWDHERHIKNESDGLVIQDGADRDYLDQKESDFALCFINKRFLSEPKIVVNTRIVVAGASDTGVSFIESLLSNRYLHFSNIYLLAPGGLNYYHINSDFQNMKASSYSYTLKESIRLLLENRVTVIDGRLIDIDREEKRVILHDESVIRYDILFLSMGLSDSLLSKLGYVSRGIAPVPEDKNYLDGVLSIDDPYLYQHFRPEGSIMATLNHRKMPGTVIIYGYTLHGYCLIQGLIAKGINPIRIKIVLQKPYFEYDEGVDPLFGGDENVLVNHNAFENDDNVTNFIHEELSRLGVEIINGGNITNVNLDEKGKLVSIVLHRGSEEHLLNCRVLVTCGQVDVDDEILHLIHDNGLVFNGRIMVSSQFQTTDESVYAAGTLCEFSQVYRQMSPGRSMRMDRYNGREIGLRAARAVLNQLDIDAIQGLFEETKEEVPYFYMPRGKGGILPSGYYYYHIVAPKYGDPRMFKEKATNREDIISNTLERNEEGDVSGHYLRLSFNNFGLIQSVTYLSKKPVVIQSLWCLVGLSETYLNKISMRFKSGIIGDVAEFFSENWAIALYHDWFPDFCLRLKSSVQDNLKDILDQVQVLVDKGETITREHMDKFKGQVPPDVRRMIHEQTLEYIRANQNHLPMYYIPGVEFD